MTNDFPVQALFGLKRMLQVSLGVFGSLLVLQPSAALAQATLPPIEIVETRSAGAGCPNGTVSASLAPDGSAISVLYDSLSAQAGGPTVAPGQFVHKEVRCAVRLKFKVPRGWTVGISQVDSRGFVSIPDEMNAFFFTRVKNDKYSPIGPVYGYQVWEDATSEDFVLESKTELPPTTRKCRSNRDEIATVRLDNDLWIWGKASAEEGMMVLDSTDGVIKQHYRLKAQRCVPDRPKSRRSKRSK